MAKADDASSTTDRVFLSKALKLATARFGLEALAKRRLREWLKSGQLPWSSWDWYGPDAKTIARLARENAENKYVGYFDPSGPYRQGDPRFWGAPTLDIKWQENRAGEAARGGAVAEGIFVTYSRLLALLPEKLRKHEQAQGAGEWITAEAKRMKKDGKISGNIRITDFAKELERRMREVATIDRSIRVVGWRYIKNNLREWDLWPISSIPIN